MPRSWSLFTRIFVGPVCLASATAFHGWVLLALLILGSIATLFAFIQTQRDLSSASARSAAEGILGTAVEFLHASGVRKVRANFMSLDARGRLRMKYESTAYGKFEVENNWEVGDGSCASKAVELRVPVLGGYPGEYEGIDPRASFRVEVTQMKLLPGEEIRSVLSVPVSRHGRGRPIGVINFDDVTSLRESRLKNPAILAAVKVVADTWMDDVPGR
jgi:hypothetical protein